MSTVIALAALVGAGCGAAGSAGEASPASSTVAPPIATAASPQPSSPSTEATTPVTASSSTQAPENTVSANDPTDGSLPVDAQYLVYGPDGIIAVAAPSELIRISTDPTAIAIGVGDALVVSQGAWDDGGLRLPGQGPIQIHQPDQVRTLPLGSDERVFLRDAGMLEGRAVVVATSIIGDGWDSEEHLLLIDVASAERTDLGVVGWYEAGVLEAKLAGDMIIVKPIGQEHLIEARRLDGETAWLIFGPNDFDNPGHVVVAGDTVLVVNPGFIGDDFAPAIEISRHDVMSGERLSFEVLAVDAEFGGGFCLLPDWDNGRLVCGESYGGPFTLDIESGSITRLTSLQRGTPSTVR